MGSRSKKMIELVIATSKTEVVTDEPTEQNDDSEVLIRPRCDSTSSSSSSSSDSSSSSSNSGPSFIEDGDDSVKDPNYIEVPRHHFSDSDSRDENVNILSQNNVISVAQEDSLDPDMSVVQELSRNSINSPNNKTGRKKRRQEGKWKKNVAKKLRNSGEVYQSLKSKKIVPERKLSPPCGEKCKFKCNSNISEEQRQQIMKQYWELGDMQKQWLFEESFETHHKEKVQSRLEKENDKKDKDYLVGVYDLQAVFN